MPDVIQQLRVEANESISGRMDMLNSINTALQKAEAKPMDSPSHIESVTSFQEAGKAATKRRTPKEIVQIQRRMLEFGELGCGAGRCE